jgi:hypothetical protein
MTSWEKWCALHGHQPVPASPTMIARFIAELSPLGVDRVWPAVLEISRAHYTIGLPDPVSSAPVTIEMNKLSGISPPRSWPREEQTRFATLPCDIQAWLSKRQDTDDRLIRKLQNELAQLKKEHANGTNAAETIDHQSAA